MKENIPPRIIDDYLNGKMIPAEREQFEQQLADDPGLARELALRRTEMAAAELLIADEARDLFREWKEQQPGGSIFSVHPILWWVVGIAAGLLLFVVAIQVWNEPPPPAAPPAVEQQAPSPETPSLQSRQPVADVVQEKSPPAKTPAKDYRALAVGYLPGPSLSNLRRPSTDSTAKSMYRQAQEAYAAGNYRQTLVLLAQVDSARQQSVAFLSAHALFHLNRFAEAEAQFASLIESNSRQYRYASEWGLLMCRLAGFPNRRPEFRQQLNDILANPDHPYFGQARELEKTLNE